MPGRRSKVDIPKKNIVLFTGYMGIAGIIVFWVFVAWSIYQNPWFSFWGNALSDLGSEDARDPWIYNMGLAVTSIFIFLFSLSPILKGENRLQIVGGSYISVSSIFVALIGLFPSGTGPHGFVSTYFFIQFFLGALVFGFSSERAMKFFTVLLLFLIIAGAFITWPSTAIVETYYIILISIFIITYVINLTITLRKEKLK